MGGPKHLLAVDGQPMLLRVVRALKASRVERVVVVLRPGDETAGALLLEEGVSRVWAEDPEEGRAASLRAGVRALPSDHAVLFALADQPWLESGDFDRLLEAAGRAGIVHASYAGERGSPVLFAACYRDALLALRGTEGGRVLIRQHADDTVAVELDPERGRDLDRPEDLR
jgi:CTP:molybdopterin cytidylyltransferase MocA